MSAFDFAFTLFGLVLGLAMAEALLGFAKVLKARTMGPRLASTIRIGWLTPAIALIVCVDLVTSWNLAWSTLEDVPVNVATLAAGLIETALYFISASLVWPDNPSDWPDLDDWFNDHKGQIGLALGLANVGFTVVVVLKFGFSHYQGLMGFLQAGYILACFSLLFTRTHRQSAISLLIMILILLYIIVETVVAMALS